MRCWNWKEYTKIWEKNQLIGSCVRRLLDDLVPCQMLPVKLPYHGNRWSSGSKIGREYHRIKIVHHPTWCHFLQVFQVQKLQIYRTWHLKQDLQKMLHGMMLHCSLTTELCAQEVRVRYAGFSKEQDEWVNVKQGVRERSIPLAPSECQKLQDGNLILCFLERDDYALYCDARIVKIQRRVHDPTECTCTFIIRYLHDQTEEEVSWNRLCCRPTEEESAVYPILAIDPTQSPSPSFSLNPIESLWG
ncbi:uncharacterized protein LOC124844479 isoform X3 [Vigna umbellata]|uniref:uncharacterized protein LOC124844479 isoform X3 n=1 Tax=Vigna umbellata TaxID=87088 RepID=UPI001F5F1F95|nr:uncharacterized protein LOC124844479 isoform X3 [Vigna umbellata]